MDIRVGRIAQLGERSGHIRKVAGSSPASPIFLLRFKWVTMERGSNAKTLAERQNCLITKDAKSTKESEDEAFDPTVKV